jgi:thiol-disulfide isomerase/thioredoxin
MMKKFIALLAFTAIFVSGCATAVMNPINELTAAEELSALDMPVVFVLAGTYCPHCVTEIPEIDAVWAEYGSDVAFWVQVVDGAEGKKFEANLPQGYNENLVYNDIAGIECAYVPSWVILDAAGEVAKTSCGNEFGTDVMTEVLDGLLEVPAEEEIAEEDSEEMEMGVDVEESEETDAEEPAEEATE